VVVVAGDSCSASLRVATTVSVILSVNNLEGTSGDVCPMEGLLALFGGFGRPELGVAEVLARKRVDVDQLAETTKRVLEYVGRKSARMADDEQSLRVTNRVVELVDGGFDRRERDVDGVEGGVDVGFAGSGTRTVAARRIRNEFHDQPAARRVFETTKLFVSILGPPFGCE